MNKGIDRVLTASLDRVQPPRLRPRPRPVGGDAVEDAVTHPSVRTTAGWSRWVHQPAQNGSRFEARSHTKKAA
jgi:hypothetical protein